MKKYLILMVAMLFATVITATAQRKIVTDRLLVTGLKNAETIGFDAKGNAVAKTFPKVDLTPIQTELKKKLNTGAYTGTAQDLATQLNDAVSKVVANEASLTDLTAIVNITKQKLGNLAVADVSGLADEIARLEVLISNASKVKTVNGVKPNNEGNVELNLANSFLPYEGATKNLNLLGRDIRITGFSRDYSATLNTFGLYAKSGKSEEKAAQLTGDGLSISDKDNKGETEVTSNEVSVNTINGYGKRNTYTSLKGQTIKYSVTENGDESYAELMFPYMRPEQSEKYVIYLPKKSGTLATVDDLPSSDKFLLYEGSTKNLNLLDRGIHITTNDRDSSVELNNIGLYTKSGRSEEKTARLTGVGLAVSDKTGALCSEVTNKEVRVNTIKGYGKRNTYMKLTYEGLECEVVDKNKHAHIYMNFPYLNPASEDENQYYRLSVPKKSGTLATLDDITQADFIGLKPTTSPVAPKAGMVYYDKTSNKLRCYNGTEWKDLF